jgi:hypothetical protein
MEKSLVKKKKKAHERVKVWEIAQDNAMLREESALRD